MNSDRCRDKIPYAAIGAVVMLITTAVLYWRYLIGEYVYIFPTMINDGIAQFYPGYLDAARNFAENGTLGFYSFSDGFGASHVYKNPFHILTFIFGETHVAYMMGLKVALCTFLSGWIMGMFLQQAGFARTTGILGSISFAFSLQVTGMGGWMTQGELGVISVITLLTIEKIVCRQKWYKWIIWLAVDSWLIFTCLNLYYELLYGALTFAYILVRVLYLKNGWRIISVKKCVLIIGLLGVLTILGIIVLEPQIRSIIGGSRFQMGIADWKNQWKATLSWDNFRSIATAYFRTLSPNIMGIAMVETYKGSPFGWYSEDGGFYVGLLPLMLVALFPKIEISKKKKIVMSFLLVCICIFTCLPGIRLVANGFANTTFKLSRLWMCLVISVCGCIVWEYGLVRNRSINFRRFIVIDIFVFLSLVITGFLAPDCLRLQESIGVITALLIFQAVLYWSCRGLRGANACKYLLLGFAGLELILSNYRFVNNSDALSSAELLQGYYFDGTKEVLQLLPDMVNEKGILQFRINKAYESVMCCDPMAQEYSGTTFYRGGADDAQTTMLLKATGIPSKSNKVGYCTGTYGYPALSAIMGVHYGISDDNVYMEQGYEFCINIGEKELYKNTNALPISFGYYQVIDEDELLQYTVRERQDILLQACVLGKTDISSLENLGRLQSGFEWNSIEPLREMTYEDYKIGTPIEFEKVSENELVVVNLQNERDVCLNMFWSTTKGRWSEKDYRTVSIYEENGNAFIEIDNQEEINGIIFYLNDDDVTTTIGKISVQVYNKAEYEKFLKDKTERLRATCLGNEIVMEQDGVIFVSIPFDAPFDYYLNGELCHTVRANYIFTGIPIEKGTYSLEIREK